MGKRILVALDDSENALRAVEYVAEVFNNDHEITLYSVLPGAAIICDMNSPGLTPYFLAQKGAFCSIQDKKRDLIEQSVKKAKEVLVAAGFQEDKVLKKIEEEKSGVARSIIKEAGSYDTLVLGRRGLSGIERFLLGSVSQKVLNSVQDVSILLVD